VSSHRGAGRRDQSDGGGRPCGAGGVRWWYPALRVPTILYEQGFRFSFFAADGQEPPHVHVVKGGAEAGWRLGPIAEA